MSAVEENGLSEIAKNDGEQRNESETGTTRFKASACRVLESGKAVAQRWDQQTRAMAGNATERIRNDPVRSVVIGFVIGLSLGALIGRLSGRQCQ